jgi:hypothetical protein
MDRGDFVSIRGVWLEVKHWVLDVAEDILSSQKKTMALLAAVFLLLGVAIGFQAKADLSFQRGEMLNHMLSVCLDKDDALEIAKADAAKGIEGAAAVFGSKDKCAPIPVQGYRVGKTIFSAPTTRNGVKVTVSVVEILNDGVVEGYFITSAPVKEALKGTSGEPIILKPERNA